MKRFFAALAAFCLLLSVFPFAMAAGNDSEFSNMSIKCSLDSGSDAEVKVDMTLRLHTEQDELVFVVPGGASQVKAPGYKSRLTTRDGQTAIVLTDRHGFAADDYTIAVTYKLKDLARADRGQDAQALTVPLLAPQELPVENLSFSVIFPEVFIATPKFFGGYTGQVVEDSLSFSQDGIAVSGSATAPLLDHETLDMSISMPAGYFSVRTTGGAGSVVFTVLSALLSVLALLYWWLCLRNRPLKIRARTLPPDGVNPGDIPYLLSGGSADFNMLVSFWATLGYLTFFINQAGHVVLRRKMNMGNERRGFERKLFDLLFRDGNTCDGASLRYKRVGEKAMEIIPRYWNKRLYEKRSGSPALARLLSCLSCGIATALAMDPVAPEVLHGLFLFMALVAGFALCWLLHRTLGAYYLGRWLYVGAGLAAGALLLLLCLSGSPLLLLSVTCAAAFLGWQTTHGGLRTPYGSEVISQTLGFRRFLHNATDHHLRQTLYRDPQYFYRVLPYAQAMGQGRRFASLLSSMELEPCQWYETAERIPLTAGEFYEHYCETLAILNDSIRNVGR